MDKAATEEFIRARARRSRHEVATKDVVWSRHALAELLDEDWEVGWVEHGLQSAEVIELYPLLHRPLPDCLVLGWLEGDRPFHAVLAVDEEKERVLVATVYQPSAAEWEDDWQTRRK